MILKDLQIRRIEAGKNSFYLGNVSFSERSEIITVKLPQKMIREMVRVLAKQNTEQERGKISNG